jgi:lambda family phage tail tape measure protein
MATIDNYKIKITVDGNDQVVDLMDNLNDLQSTLNKTTAAGIAAFTGLAASAIRMADGMVDLSDATGISVGKIYQLSAALETSGGQFEDADKFIKSFSNTLGQVEKGSTDAIASLQKLGLSRKEIETLSDEQLFARAVQGLANMENGFAKTKLATELFGKSAASIDFAKLAQETSKAVDPNLERNLRLAADAVNSLEVIFRNLQTAALEAIAPILQGLAQFEFSAENAKTAIQVLGSLIAAAFAASTVIQIAKIVKLIKDLGNVTKAAAAAQAFLVGLSGVGLAAVAASAAAATAAYVALGKAMEGAADEKAKLETGGATPETPGAGRTVGQTPEERALAAVRETTRQMRERNAEANRYQRIINDTIGKSQREADLIKVMADLERNAANDKLDLQKQIDAEIAKGVDSNKAVVTELQKQLVEVDNQLAVQKQLKREELDRLLALQQYTEEVKKSATLEQFNLQARIEGQKALLMLQAANGELTDKQAKIGTQLAEAQMRFEQERIRLAQERLLLGERATQQEIANFETLERMNQTRYANELRNIADTEAAELLKSQNVYKGIEDAMANIGAAFTPYKMAQDAILQGWNRIGSAIDTFIETGKFKFSDFARSVLADLAKMIAKAMIFKAISGIAGAFGLSIPGLAKGGSAKAGEPYIVGEKGPELFVPKQAGSVIPNNKMGSVPEGVATGAVNAPVTNNYITNNISAIDAKSVAQLFAENRKTLLGSVKMAEREMPYMAR